MSDLFLLSRNQINRIKTYFPMSHGVPRVDDVRVISGREEGLLIAKGVMANIVTPKGRYALVDIGGGSTEISICSRTKILKCESFRLGANRLQQMFCRSNPVPFKVGSLHPTLALRQYIREKLMPVADFISQNSVQTVIGSSGTIRSAAKILKKLGCGDRLISRMDLAGLVSELQLMNLNELRRVPGLEAKRADIIVPGLILLEEILYALKTPQMKVTEHALREGILQQTLSEI